MDIMSGKQPEELDLVRRFARSLAHDANNLTGTILVLSELLGAEGLATPERTADLAAKIRKACWHLQVKINQPVAADHLMLGARVHVDTGAITDVLRDLATSLAPKKIAIRIAGPAEQVSAAGTPLLYAIIIFNLLRNAIEAIGVREGEIAAGMAVCRGADARLGEALAFRGSVDVARSYLRLSVEDTGDGPDGAIVDSLFVPFACADRAGRKLGLGLHYVEAIAVGLGGAVAMRRDVRTTVDVFIPLADEAARADGEGGEAWDTDTGVPGHVAVVTGDTGWVMSFAALAGPFGLRVSHLSEPEEIADSIIGEYSSVIFTGDRFDSAALEELHGERKPFLVVADPGSEKVRENLENIRPLNLVWPAAHSPAEALHRLISYGALR
jgi:hypothetical protein